MATDPYERREEMFPRLTPELVELARSRGTVRPFAKGEVLFEVGSQHHDFLVVLEGEIEIVQPAAAGHEERTITVHGPGEFTGEIDMFSSRRSLVLARGRTAGRAIVIPRCDLAGLLAADATLNEIVMRAFILRRHGLIVRGQSDLVLLGSRYSSDTLRVRSFLSRNGHPYRDLDLEDDEDAREMLSHFGLTPKDVPVLVMRDRIARNPGNREIADCLGLSGEVSPDDIVDVVVVGAGPAGLAAAVYAASEGLSVVVFEADAPGGQAGTSSRIENYLGFPTGITGQDLAARALNQAQKFGARLLNPRRAVALDCAAQPYRITLDDGDTLRAHTVVVATGARWRRPDIPGLAEFDGKGVYYGATSVEATLCGEKEVAIVGGGNSAGQAAVYLSERARHVHLLVRGEGLAATMSRYLCARIEASPRITLHVRTEVVGLEGNGALTKQVWRRSTDGRTETREVPHLFVMIGATPNTDWLRGCLALDRAGFLRTGQDVLDAPDADWPARRPPYFLETSRPRIFAVGDVRSNSIKRVASAVGEGAMSVHFIHRVLHETH